MQSPLPSFDELLKLAKQSPEELEQLKRKLINEVIDSAGDSLKNRLKGLQFNIDMEIRRSKTPMASCMKISQMMHESIGRLRTMLDEFESPSPVITKAPADVICFEKAKLTQA